MDYKKIIGDKRIRPAKLRLRELEGLIEIHERVIVHFRTADIEQEIKNVGLYVGWKTNWRSLERLPRAKTSQELDERIRLYTDIGYVGVSRYASCVTYDRSLDGQVVHFEFDKHATSRISDMFFEQPPNVRKRDMAFWMSPENP